MEAGSANKWAKIQTAPKVFFVIAVVLLSVVFWVVVWNIGSFAYDNGLFYMHPDLPKGFASLTLFLTLIYLWFTSIDPRKANWFAGITASILLAVLFTLTAVETAKYESITKISEDFVTPVGWVKSPSKEGKYEYFGSTWSKDDRNTPFTSEDLQQIASTNNIENHRMDGDCPPSPPRMGCSLYGDINGIEVQLLYKKGDRTILSLSIEEPSPPKSYKPETYAGIDDGW